MTLTEFLLARITEDNRAAIHAARFADAVDGEPSDNGDRWTAQPDGSVWTERQPISLPPGLLWEPKQVAEHIARHDPSSVLAECEAKRRIVERHGRCGTGMGYCDDGGHGWGGEDGLGCADLADLAAVYADHPDYREKWRPHA